jgi:hypothetical protein
MPSGVYQHKPYTDDRRKEVSERMKKLGIKPPLIRDKNGKVIYGGMLGKHHSEKTKKTISEYQKGKNKSLQFVEKCRKRMSGKGNPMYGKIKELCPSWKGGTSFEPYSVDWTETLKRSIRERDNYICQLCSRYGNVVHHIDYNKKNCCPENLINLCNNDNARVNFNRKNWIDYFKSRVKKT